MQHEDVRYVLSSLHLTDVPCVAEDDYVAFSSDWCELVKSGEDEHSGLAHA